MAWDTVFELLLPLNRTISANSPQTLFIQISSVAFGLGFGLVLGGRPGFLRVVIRGCSPQAKAYWRAQSISASCHYAVAQRDIVSLL